MNWDKLKDAANVLARPFTIYSTTVATVVGLFVPSVPAEKLLIVAGLAGGGVIARAIDRRTDAKIAAAQQAEGGSS